MSGTVGSTAVQSFTTYQTASEAAAAASSVLEHLKACNATRWDIRTLEVEDASDAAIASRDEGAVWIVRSARSFTTLGVVQAGPPTQQAASAVGGLMMAPLATGHIEASSHGDASPSP